MKIRLRGILDRIRELAEELIDGVRPPPIQDARRVSFRKFWRKHPHPVDDRRSRRERRAGARELWRIFR